MSRRATTKRRAQSYSTALFLIGLAILAFTGRWWPGIMLVIGLPLALRQYLLGRQHDMLTSLFIFIGVYVTAKFDISWRILLPVLFTTGAIYILFREFLENRAELEDEREDDLNVEIEIEEYRSEE